MIAAVLAGGQSTRFGSDKATFVIEGKTMLERVVQAACSADLDVMVVGRDSPLHWQDSSVRFVNDELVRCGPVTGLISALRNSGESILALACDMPDMTREAIQWLVKRASDHQMGVVTRTSDQVHPLFAVYHTPMLRVLEQQVDLGNFSITRIVEQAGLTIVPLPSALEPAVRNINLPPERKGAGQCGD